MPTKWTVLRLPGFRHCLESDVVREEWTTQLGRMFEQHVIGEARGPIFLRCQQIDVPKA